MLKFLRGIAIRILPWILGGCAIVWAVIFVASQQHAAAQKYEATREERCAVAFELDAKKQDTCKHERDSSADYMDWRYVLFAWPEGITAWAIITTGIAIFWQANETRAAARAAKDGAKSALDQIEMMKAKERARLVIRIIPNSLSITDINWDTTFRINNIGSSHAFEVWIWATFEFSQSFVPPEIPRLSFVKRSPRLRIDKRVFATCRPEIVEDREIVTWSEEKMRQVAIGETFLHLRGTVEYQDIFGDPHLIPFRFMWSPDIQPDGWGTSANPRWFEAVHFSDPNNS
jgi:hypothetical protein